MASLTTDKNGNVTIQFVAGDKKRRSVRLGKVSKKVGNELKLKVDTLNAVLIAVLPLDADLARWVAALGDTLYAKLAAVGLLPPRQSATLGEYLSSYIERRKADAKGATITNFISVQRDPVNYFGKTTDLRTICEKRADEFRLHFLTREPKLAAATVAGVLKTVRMFFEHAEDEADPVESVPKGEGPFLLARRTAVLPQSIGHREVDRHREPDVAGHRRTDSLCRIALPLRSLVVKVGTRPV